MASFVERGGRWRALVRKAGMTKCRTFGSKAAARKWADTIEGQIDELRASGVMSAKGVTVANLIDRYVDEFYPRKQWGRSKAADLARLKADLGHHHADKLTSHILTTYFQKRANEGSGGVVVSAQIGYLIVVLRTARELWHLDVPAKAAEDARSALSKADLVGKSEERSRRASDAEIGRVLRYLEKHQGRIPMADLVRMCLASAMRISEVCRIEWRDLDERRKTVVVRDRKHPTKKRGNDQTVPLLNATGFDAFALVMRQPPTAGRIFPYSAKTVSTLFARATEKLGIEDLTLHDLRHEATSRLFEAGYRIEQVALVTGHRDWKMLARYTHVKASDLHRPESTT